MAPGFIVHAFLQESGTISSTPELLSQGQVVIEDATKSSGWLTLDPTHQQQQQQAISEPVTTRRSYLYRYHPPKVSGTWAPFELKEWGEPADDSEIYRLEDLDEFESTDFTAVLYPPLVPITNATQVIPDAAPLPAAARFKTDSLYSVIPQPHFQHSPFIPSFPQPTIPPFLRTRPIPIPPSASLPPLNPAPAHTRWAWLVPLRGALPWAPCTPAVFLHALDAPPAPSDPRAHSPMVWSVVAARSLWAYLNALRERANLGPIALSFHAAAAAIASTQPRMGGSAGGRDGQSQGKGGTGGAGETGTRSGEGEINGFGQVGYESLENQRVAMAATTTAAAAAGDASTRSNSSSATSAISISSANATANPTPDASRVSLAGVDYIKIYHEAAYAMHVRNALYIWWYEHHQHTNNDTDAMSGTAVERRGDDEGAGGKRNAGEGGQLVKIRVLKGARLALVDHKARGLLVS